MRRTWMALGLVLAVAVGGCAVGTSARKDSGGEREITKATVVVCPKCQHHFHVGAGLTDEEMLE